MSSGKKKDPKSATQRAIAYQLANPNATAREVARAIGGKDRTVMSALTHARMRGELPEVPRGRHRLGIAVDSTRFLYEKLCAQEALLRKNVERLREELAATKRAIAAFGRGWRKK